MVVTILLAGVLALVSTATFVWLVVVAFRKHPAWGVSVLLLSPFSGIVFAIRHWQDAKRPFLATTVSGIASIALLLAVVGAGVSRLVALSREIESAAVEASQPPPEPPPIALISAPAPEASDEAEPEAARMAGAADLPAIRTPKPRITADGYLLVDVTDAPAHVGEPIRVTSRDGRVYRGYLARADARSILLERPLGGGSVTVEIRPAEVRELQVAVN